MLTVRKFTFNPFSENTYIISGESKDSIIIDPGCFYDHEKEELDTYISNNNLQLKCVLHTHSHLDHMFGTSYISKKYNINVWIHSADRITYDSFQKVCDLYSIPISNSSNPNPKYFSLDDIFHYGDIKFKILFVPGHSPGHVAFYNKENSFVINGDCLFENSIGRTDLPGGDHGSLIKSIKDKLFQLPDNTLVYCGHGNETTIKKEKSGNPFLL